MSRRVGVRVDHGMSERASVQAVLCTSASVCCGSGRVCVFVSISGAVRCSFGLSCVNVEWGLRTVDLVCLVWASTGGSW